MTIMTIDVCAFSDRNVQRRRDLYLETTHQGGGAGRGRESRVGVEFLGAGELVSL